MTQNEFLAQCRIAAKIVQTCPLWKQNLLRDSMRASWDEPRPVIRRKKPHATTN